MLLKNNKRLNTLQVSMHLNVGLDPDTGYGWDADDYGTRD